MRRTSWKKQVLLAAIIFTGLVAGLLALLVVGIEAGWARFLAGLLMATIMVPFYIAIAMWVDRFEPEPPWLLATAFFWGATTAILFAIIFNGIDEAVLSALLGREAGSTLT